MRWSTTIALIALEKLKQQRELEVSDRAALLRLADDLHKIAEENENLDGEVLFVRRLSGHRPSGSLRRLLAMNSPKLSSMNPASLEQVAMFVAHLAQTKFLSPEGTAAEESLGQALSTCQALLKAI